MRMQNCVGMIEYLMGWKWSQETGVIQASYASDEILFRADALPYIIEDDG